MIPRMNGRMEDGSTFRAWRPASREGGCEALPLGDAIAGNSLKKKQKKIKKKREIKNPMKDPVRGLGGEGGSNRSPAETESKFVAIDFDSRCTARRLRQSFAGITNQLGSTQSAQVDLGEKNNSAANQKQRRFVFQDLDVRCYHGTLFLLARVPSQVPRARRGLLNFIRTDVESTFLPR